MLSSRLLYCVNQIFWVRFRGSKDIVQIAEDIPRHHGTLRASWENTLMHNGPVFLNFLNNCGLFGAKPSPKPVLESLPIEPLATNFSEIWINVQQFILNLTMSFSKWQPFCLGLNSSLTSDHAHHGWLFSWYLREPGSRTLVPNRYNAMTFYQNTHKRHHIAQLRSVVYRICVQCHVIIGRDKTVKSYPDVT